MATTTLYASAARTATPAAVILNPCQQTTNSFLLTLGVTVAAASGGITLKVIWTDAVNSNNSFTYISGPHVATVSTTTWEIKPGELLADANNVVPSSLPLQGSLSVQPVHDDATNSFTYSLTLTQS